jgi:hypothetical protein
MQEGKVVGIITVTDLARYIRTILLLEGALDANRTDSWSDNTTTTNTTTPATSPPGSAS